MDLKKFKNFIKEKIGLSFNKTLSEILDDAIVQRMLATGIGCPEDYFDHASHDSDEFLILLNLLTINETFFFREPAHIRLFVDRLIPSMLSKSSGRKLKILSAGCSSGEEPYTLVIALTEKFGDAIFHRISIIGVDLDRDAIAKAKSGIYTKQSFRGMDAQLIDRYFLFDGNSRYHLTESIKTAVEFHTFNILESVYPKSFHGIDTIFYRNVSIYFEQDTQKDIFIKLSNMLNENGYLFVGTTETLSHDFHILNLIEMDGVFLFHKSNQPQITDRKSQIVNRNSQIVNRKLKLPNRTLHIADRQAPIIKPQSSIEEKSPDTLFHDAVHLSKAKKYDQAIEIIDDLLVKKPDFVNAYTLKAAMSINLGKIDEADKLCKKAIAIDRLSMEAAFLSGLIARIQNRRDEAIKRLKEALYLHPPNWLARFYLAELHQSGQEFQKALREYQNVIKLIETGHFNNHGIPYFQLPFSEHEILHMCKKNIEKAIKMIALR